MVRVRVAVVGPPRSAQVPGETTLTVLSPAPLPPPQIHRRQCVSNSLTLSHRTRDRTASTPATTATTAEPHDLTMTGCGSVRRLTPEAYACDRRCVSGATRLQIRSRSVAAITALWLVVCGILAMRHEATTAHTLDDTGAYVHATALTVAHTSPDSDIHGQRNPENGSGHCALLTGFHQAGSAEIARPTVGCAPHANATPSTLCVARVAHRTTIYRLAPKTSPPVAA